VSGFGIKPTKRQDRIRPGKAVIGSNPKKNQEKIGTDDFLSVYLPP
jgi:hypothetical protein